MRIAIVLVAVLLAASVSSANPSPAWPVLFIDFDEDGLPDGDPVVDYIAPAPYTNISAYVGLSCTGTTPYDTFSAVSFGLNDIAAEYPGMAVLVTFENLMPGDLSVGDPFDGGITIATGDCVTTSCVFLGRVDFFYLGGWCCIEIRDHTDYPRWVVDCQDPGQVHYYCVGNNGSVGGATCAPGEDCGFYPCDNASPVEDISWGAIKALYY
ncbi:MAG TPA: hypothetical protein VE960_04655 [bacterium]|nr:hypothetical protein [bacterium]